MIPIRSDRVSRSAPLPGGPPDPERVADLARLRRPSRLLVIVAVVVLGGFVVSAHVTDLSVGAVVAGLPDLLGFVGHLFPPDLSVLPAAGGLMAQTLAIAFAGTVLGVAMAVPLALLAARNVTRAWVRQVTRLGVNVVRAVPELMWALLFVTAVGLGPIAGALAIATATGAGLGRLFADIFEAADMSAWEAARASGARKAQAITWVLLPEQLPTMASYALLVLDANVRAASLLGLVGAGGIGLELTIRLRLFDYGKVSTILIVILVVVVALDQISSYLRRRLV